MSLYLRKGKAESWRDAALRSAAPYSLEYEVGRFYDSLISKGTNRVMRRLARVRNGTSLCPERRQRMSSEAIIGTIFIASIPLMCVPMILYCVAIRFAGRKQREAHDKLIKDTEK